MRRHTLRTRRLSHSSSTCSSIMHSITVLRLGVTISPPLCTISREALSLLIVARCRWLDQRQPAAPQGPYAAVSLSSSLATSSGVAAMHRGIPACPDSASPQPVQTAWAPSPQTHAALPCGTPCSAARTPTTPYSEASMSIFASCAHSRACSVASGAVPSMICASVPGFREHGTMPSALQVDRLRLWGQACVSAPNTGIGRFCSTLCPRHPLSMVLPVP